MNYSNHYQKKTNKKRTNDYEVAQFLDLFSPKLVWDFVPLKFLYDLYKSYYKKEKQKETSIMYKSFNKLVKIWCDVNFTWMIPTNKKEESHPLDIETE